MLGKGIVYAADSKAVQWAAAVAGGATGLPNEKELNDAGNVTKKGMQVVGSALGNVGDVAKKGAQAVGLALGNTAVELGYGEKIVNIGKKMLAHNIDFSQQIQDRILELDELTGSEAFSDFIVHSLPLAFKHADKWIGENTTEAKRKLWTSQKDFAHEATLWMLLSGAANLFAYMQANPLEQVDQMAQQLNLSPVEKLGYYMYSVLSPRLDDIEAGIEKDVADGKLVLHDDADRRAKQLKRYFEPLGAELIVMAFGDTKKFGKLQKFILRQAKGFIAENMAKLFRTGKKGPNDNLEALSIPAALNKLNDLIKNEETVNLLDNATSLIANKLIPELEKFLVKELFNVKMVQKGASSEKLDEATARAIVRQYLEAYSNNDVAALKNLRETYPESYIAIAEYMKATPQFKTRLIQLTRAALLKE
jgi:hypothetical protein